MTTTRTIPSPAAVARTGLAAALALLALASPVFAQDAPVGPPSRELIRSDLPLFRGGAFEKFPQPVFSEESIGCYSPVAFGDWEIRERAFRFPDDAPGGEASGPAEAETLWMGVENYGVFHCFALVSRSHERAGLDAAEAQPSFFVLLGEAGTGAARRELWALQIGARPGSEYLLLARTPGEERVTRFDMLQTDCPRGNVRDAGPLDILVTRYCAINSTAELVRMARRMVRKPPLAVLSHVPPTGRPAE